MTVAQQNLIPNEVELRDLLNLFEKNLMLKFNSHHIATIQDFNPAQQTASATINYKKSFSLPNAAGSYTEQLVDYPLLVNCPVIFLGGGETSLTFPVDSGDTCLVLFNDRDMDNWFAGSTSSAPHTSRLHSFSDGIIIVGPRALRDVITDFDTSRATLRYGLLSRVAIGETQAVLENGPKETPTCTVGAVSGKALIQNVASGDQTLNDLLQSLSTQLTSLCTAIAAITVTGVTTGPGTSGPPANAPIFATISTQISLIATQLGELLA